MVAVHERANGVQLDDRLRLGRGDDAAVTAARVLNDLVAALGDHLVGLFLGHEGADGLGGVLEGGVLGVHLDLGEHSGDTLVDAAVEQLLAQGVLQVVAYIALAHGDADGQRAGDVLLGVRAGELGHGGLDHAHLGAVAVGHDDLVAALDEVGDGFGGLLDGDHLLGEVVAQGVSAESDYYALTHYYNTSFKNLKAEAPAARAPGADSRGEITFSRTCASGRGLRGL